MNTTSNDFAKQGQDFADKTAHKVQSGIRGVRQTAAKVADKLSIEVEGARSQPGPSISRTTRDTDSSSPRTLEQFRFTGDLNMLAVIARWCHNSLLTAVALLTIAIVVSTM